MLSKLEIKNFKCFLETEIPFNKLTVLAGINGVGKSTIIQSLLLLRQVFDTLETGYSEIIKKGDIKSRTFRQKKPLNVQLNNAYDLSLGSSRHVTCAYSDSSEFTIAPFVANLEKPVKFEFNASKDSPDQIAKILINSSVVKSYFEMKDYLSIANSTGFYYLQAERIGPRFSYSISSENFLHTGHKGEYTPYAIYKADVQSLILDENKILPQVPKLFLKQVEAWMNLIVPGVEFQSILKEEVNAVQLGIRKKASATGYLLPNNIGFGISYVLPIIVNGLLANKNTMFIVENPEAHLHPSGQSMIGFFLAKIASADVQVIVETHSEHVINGMRKAVLHDALEHNNVTVNFFEHKEGEQTPNVRSINLNKKADLDEWPKGFFDQQERDLAEIFRLKRKIKE